jgi:hypothetical protein
VLYHAKAGFDIMNRFLALIFVFFIGSITNEAYPQTTQKLFSLGRNKNSNKVCYEARIAKDGLLDREEPVRAYWINFVKDSSGNTVEELSLLEKNMVYGCKVNGKGDGKSVEMTIVSYPDRTITVSLQNGNATAQTIINGHPSFIDSIFIRYRETRMFPKVTAIELFGRALKGNASLFESIKPK